MKHLGYALSSEEFRPSDLVRNAIRAEQIGFEFALISDHFHPWMESQGQSPFVWSTLGAIAQTTSKLRVGTGVTCPLVRLHPAIIAQAAATVADMFDGRFFLGLGTGEALNEHITGLHWPPVSVRLEMLGEAVEMIRKLWEGDYTTIHGRHFTVENAKIYTLPAELPPIAIAASGVEAASFAGEYGDALVSTAPDADIVNAFQSNGGREGFRYGQLTVCWAPDKTEAIRTAKEIWGFTGVPGQLSQELALPLYFDQVARIVNDEEIEKSVVCGPDASAYIEKIQSYFSSGFTHVYLHQVGPDQEGFFQFAQQEILPWMADQSA